MRVMKFGGAVMRSPEGFAAMTSILQQYRGEPLLVVVSAFSTVTRDLRHAAALAEQGDEQASLALADSIIEQHQAFAQELLQDEATRQALDLLLRESGKRLREYLRGVAITHELTPRTLDAVMSYGEYLAVHIVKHYLQEEGCTTAFVDSADIVVTDEHYGAAAPNRERTAGNVEDRLLPLLHQHSMVVTQGFVGKSTTGEITTMGMESSNLTATLLAELLGAREVIVWTDVDGIRSADPRFADGTVSVPHLSYAQAFAMATNGVKLLHPNMIEPVRRSSIPLHVRSAFEPGCNGTMITRATPAVVPPVLSLRFGVTVLHVERAHANESLPADPPSLLRNPESVLAFSRRSDSVSVLALCPVSDVYLHLLSVEAAVQTWADYALICIIGATPSAVLDALRHCDDILRTVRLPFIEVGAQPAVARIAVPEQQAQPLFQRLHDILAHSGEQE